MVEEREGGAVEHIDVPNGNWHCTTNACLEMFQLFVHETSLQTSITPQGRTSQNVTPLGDRSRLGTTSAVESHHGGGILFYYHLHGVCVDTRRCVWTYMRVVSM